MAYYHRLWVKGTAEDHLVQHPAQIKDDFKARSGC